MPVPAQQGPPSAFPQTGVRLLVHTWGSTFSVDDTQFRSYMGASFQLWWIISCQRAIRMGNELFFPKLGGDCSLGVWSWALWRGTSCRGRGLGFGNDSLGAEVSRWPLVSQIPCWCLSKLRFQHSFTLLDKLKVNAVTPVDCCRVQARKGMRAVSCNTMNYRGCRPQNWYF